jgi:hypothetical protein
MIDGIGTKVKKMTFVFSEVARGIGFRDDLLQSLHLIVLDKY